MRRTSTALPLLVSLFATSAAAHELSCEQTFNGQQLLFVDQYPLTVQVIVTVANEHPASPSDALAVTGELLPPALFDTPFTIPVGEEVSQSFSFEIASYEACLQFAAAPIPGVLISTVTVAWDLGAAQCSARLVCQPAVCQ